MAAYTVYVSRAGLTQCPACTAHIRVAPEVRHTECEFCGAVLERAVRAVRAAGPSGTGPLAASVSRLARAGRSGLMAASLFGIATVGAMGCDDEEEPMPGSDAAMDATTTGDATATGTGADTSTATGMDVSTASDTGTTTSIALYGVPADITESDATESDTVNVALYGVPADIDDNFDVEDAADAPEEALYGIVPADVIDDAG